MILVRLMKASAIGLVLLAMIFPRAPVVSAADEAPEIIVLKYLRALYILPSTEMFSAATYPDQSYCSAYVLLSQESRAKVTPQDFLSYARMTLTSFEQVGMLYARVKDNSARVNIRYSVDTYTMSTTLTISLAKDARYERFELYQTTKDPDGWRVVLDAIQFARVLQAANAYRSLVKKDVRFALPAESCAQPGATQ